MATHSQNIDNLRNAVYGEQVRTSMIQLFEEDYALVKGGIGIGTDVSSASSPLGDYVDGNVYINSTTLDIFKCNGTAWVKVGNLKGIADITAVTSSADDGLNQVTFTLTDGTTKTFNVKNGSKGSTGVSVQDAIDNGDGTFKFKLTDGTFTNSSITTIKGDTGSKGDKGDKGDTGASGKDVTKITSTDSGKDHILTAEYSDGTSNIIATIKDGADGSGTGDMVKSTYDKDGNGIVDQAEALFDTTSKTKIPAATVMNKADKATTLGGYGITDAYTKAEVTSRLGDKISEPANDGSAGQALVTDGNGNRSWADAGLSTTDKYKLSKVEMVTDYATEWKSGSYLKDDVVSHNNVLYVALAMTSEEPSATATNWAKFDARSITNKISAIDGKIANPTTKSDGQVLTYNGTSGNWEAKDSQGGGSAEDIEYDNTTSELEAENVQDAIDEITEELSTVDISSLISFGSKFGDGSYNSIIGYKAWQKGDLIIFSIKLTLTLPSGKALGFGDFISKTPIFNVGVAVGSDSSAISSPPINSLLEPSGNLYIMNNTSTSISNRAYTLSATYLTND